MLAIRAFLEILFVSFYGRVNQYVIAPTLSVSDQGIRDGIEEEDVCKFCLHITFTKEWNVRESTTRD